MNFKIGDQVRFLNERGEGIITRIINKNTVGVTIEDGFEIPFDTSNLVILIDNSIVIENPVVEPVSKPVQKTVVKSPLNYEELQEGEGVYLAFSPENEKDIAHSNINVWLINRTDYDVLYSYSIWNNSTYLTLETGTINKFNADLVQTIYRNELNDHRNFKIDALFYSKQVHDHQPPVSNVIKLKPIKLYKDNAFKTNNLIADKALIFPVYRFVDHELEAEQYTIAGKNLAQIFSNKENAQQQSKKSKPHSSNNLLNEMEIDLHIEELLDEYSNMSNAEIVRVQLTYFQNALDKAMSGHFKKLVVIHGVGNGRLKQEVRTIAATYPSLKCYDASYARFGFGATEIRFF